ncbi:hypothetical protein [uncultured Anaerococcus sp.]|uniref:hypothetical protein n=1 Tax=uncultured Anaerococcus sp. TaxID=293428 RepID=UPI00288B55EF|nr:hypothetical protein [uncultured Anaerococcus sp.]
MRYLKIFIITLIITFVMEFLTRKLIEKYGKDRTISILKTIAVVAIAMFLKEII